MVHLGGADLQALEVSPNVSQAEDPLAKFPCLSFPSQWNLLRGKGNEESKRTGAVKEKVLRKVDCEHGDYKAMWTI